MANENAQSLNPNLSNAPLRVLVTGANGFVGSALCKKLTECGRQVTQAVRSRTADQLQTPEVVETGNLNGQTDWKSLLGGCAVVVHLAAHVHQRHGTAQQARSLYHVINVEATLHLARQAAQVGVGRFVFLSSVKAMAERTLPGLMLTEESPMAPLDAYGESKRDAEHGLQAIAAQTGMQVVIVRPPLVYGPGVKANFASLVRLVQSGIPLPLASLQNQRSLVSLANLIDFLRVCLESDAAANQVFLVSDGQDCSTPELIRGIAAASHQKARLFHVPAAWLEMLARRTGKLGGYQRLAENLQVDISKARQLLKWQPPQSLQAGLQMAVQLAVLPVVHPVN